MTEIQRQGDKIILAPKQDIVASMVEDFQKDLKQAVQEQEGKIAVDLSKVEMIDSMGLGVLIATHKTLQNYGESLEILNPNQNIMNLLKTMRLDQHFYISG